MCSVCGNAAGVAIGRGSDDVLNEPWPNVKPVGVFIQAFAITTKMPDATPLQRDQYTRKQWRGGTLLPPVEVDAQKDCFGEEGKPSSENGCR